MAHNEPAQTASYDPAFFASLYAIEDRHFWFRARNRAIATLARQAIAHRPPGYRVLEVGCGTGNVLRMLERVCDRATVVGMDLFAEGLRFARTRTKCSLVQGDIHSPAFDKPFDVIGCFDVLEHLPDDRQVLRDVRGLLAPNGKLLLTVPAHQSLWSYFDEASHHCRRYEFDEMAAKLADAGFQVEYQTEFMTSIFPLVWLGRRLAALSSHLRRRGESDSGQLAANELRITPVINDVLTIILTYESRLIATRRRLPFGTSMLVVAAKSPDSVP